MVPAAVAGAVGLALLAGSLAVAAAVRRRRPARRLHLKGEYVDREFTRIAEAEGGL
jgi:hypothetical protein